jgi:hypothetical protein
MNLPHPLAPAVPLLLFALLALPASQPAQAKAKGACDIAAPATVDLVPGGYRPIVAAPTAVREKVKLASDACELSANGLPVGQTGELLLAGPDAEPLRVTFQLAGGGKKAELWTEVPAGQWVPPGTYRAALRLEARPAGGPAALADVELSATVLPSLRVTVAGGGTLDFGQLYTDQRAGLRVEVDANTSYRAVLASDNGGRLQHTAEPGAYVPYGVSVDGLPLAGSASYAWNGASRTVHALEVTIGSVQRALAGRYEDRWVLTVTAQ